jgi:hypothetical protein
MDAISIKEIYNNLTQLVIHAESVVWDRFNSYLVGNSILVLAWATVFVSPSKSKLLLVPICVFGMIASIIFSILGCRGKTFLSKYIELGSLIEDDPQCWPTELNKKFKLLKETESLRDHLSCSRMGGHFVLICGPGAFAIFYIFLLCLSLIG